MLYYLDKINYVYKLPNNNCMHFKIHLDVAVTVPVRIVIIDSFLDKINSYYYCIKFIYVFMPRGRQNFMSSQLA